MIDTGHHRLRIWTISGAWRLDPGTKVRLVTGPFAGREATLVSWSGADRARLIAWLLNRDTVVEVHAADIVAVAAESSPEMPQNEPLS